MNLKLKAFGYTCGVFAFVFAIIVGLSYLTPENVKYILGAGFIGYLMYLMYQIKLAELKWRKDRTFD
jgi:hypothetical protein